MGEQITRALYDDQVAAWTAVKNRALAIAANYKAPALKDAIADIAGRATIGLADLAAAQVIEPAPPPPDPVPDPPPPPPPPPPADVLDLAGTTVSAASVKAWLAAKTGAVTVTNGTVGDWLQTTRPDVTYSGITFRDGIEFGPGAHRCALIGCTSNQFNIFGADARTTGGGTSAGQRQAAHTQLWDRPAGRPARRFKIRNSTFRRFWTPDPSNHSEALFIGYSEDGLVEGCRFEDNGTTAHIFFTWWGDKHDSATTYPRRVCVRANTYGARHGAYYDVNFRAEIPTSSGICIDPAQGATVTHTAFVRTCPAA